MRISVVVPCYNAGPWIADALCSIAGQTYEPHEIIVIDDGSTDDSVVRIRASGVNIDLLHTQRANGAGARNAGIEAATGDWIAFLDADDLWYPNHLERAIKTLDGTDDVALLGYQNELHSDGTILRRRNRWPFTKPCSELADVVFLDCFCKQWMFTMPAVVARRDTLLAVGMFDTSLVRRHDMDMWLRVTKGNTWSYDPVPTTLVRPHTPNSVSRANLASSTYWFLRMLLRNQESYDCPSMHSLIRKGAFRAMKDAFTEGGPEDRRLVKPIAWPHLSLSHRMIFKTFALCPFLMSWAKRAKNRMIAPSGGTVVGHYLPGKDLTSGQSPEGDCQGPAVSFSDTPERGCG